MSAYKVFARLATIPLLILSTTLSYADKTVKLQAKGLSSQAERAQLDVVLREALVQMGHTLATDAEVVRGEAAAGGSTQTSTALVAIGKTSDSLWVIEAVLDPTVKQLFSVHLRVCQVSSGRVESLQRELSAQSQWPNELKEMLALLLREKGVADDPIPWLQQSGTSGVPSGVPSAGPSGSSPSVSTSSLPVPKESEPAVRYGEGGPMTIGVGGGLMYLLARPSNAVGGRMSGSVFVAGSLALGAVRGLELVAGLGTMFGSAGAMRLDVGARYLLQTGRWGFGVEATLGAFLPLKNSPRFGFAVSPVLSFALSKHIELDANVGAFRISPGGSGLLVFGGLELSGRVRF